MKNKDFSEAGYLATDVVVVALKKYKELSLCVNCLSGSMAGCFCICFSAEPSLGRNTIIRSGREF